MKKLILQSIIIGFTLCGCVVSSLSAAAEKVTLKYFTWQDEQPYIDEAVSAFNQKNPDIQVEVNYIPGADFGDKIMVMFAGGADFDLVNVNGINLINNYVSKKALADITPYITENKVDTTAFGPIYEQLTIDGKKYGLPYRRSCWLLFYNTDIFQTEGLQAPGQMTWTEYAEVAKKLTKGENETKQWGGFWVPWIKNFTAVQRGVTLLDNDLAALQESAEFLNQLYNVDQSHMSLIEQKATKADWIGTFEGGNVALLPNGDWTINMLVNDIRDGKTDIHWDIAPMPVPEGVEPGTTWGQQMWVAVTEKSKHKEAAFEFCKFLASEEGQMIIARSGILPALNDEGVKSAFVEVAGKESVSVIFDSKLTMEFPMNNYIDAVVKAYGEEMDLYLTGEKDIASAMADFEKRRTDELSK